MSPDFALIVDALRPTYRGDEEDIGYEAEEVRARFYRGIVELVRRVEALRIWKWGRRREKQDGYEREDIQYWYVLEYPEELVAGFVFRVDVAERWKQTSKAPWTPELMPVLAEVIREATIEVWVETELYGSLAESLEEALWQNESHGVTVDPTTTVIKWDGSEEKDVESESPTVYFNFRNRAKAGDVTVKEEGSGKVILRVASLIEVGIRRVDMPFL